jgi:hypothetical protein
VDEIGKVKDAKQQWQQQRELGKIVFVYRERVWLVLMVPMYASAIMVVPVAAVVVVVVRFAMGSEVWWMGAQVFLLLGQKR